MSTSVSFDLSGKRALVTGGRRGIGLAISRGLGDFGARVTVTGTGDGPAEVEGFAYCRLDVCDQASVERAAAGVEELDILVNCAGALVRDAKEYEPEVFASILDVNLTGAFRMCMAFFPQLRASRGCVVNISSQRGIISSPANPAYGAGKAGLIHVTQSLAMRRGPDGIRFNAIAPGFARTDINVVLQQDEVMSRQVAEAAALKRWGLPEDIAGAAVYLASPAAAFVTGACLLVDGGYTLRS